jgi:plastocyanin
MGGCAGAASEEPKEKDSAISRESGSETEKTAHEIRVETREHKFVPDHFQLSVGEAVTFVVRNDDEGALHTFSVKKSKEDRSELFSLEVPGGTVRTYTFTPDNPGELYLYCKNHENDDMVGTITVVSGPASNPTFGGSESGIPEEESSGSEGETEIEWD